MNKEYYKRHSEHLREYHKAYRLQHPRIYKSDSCIKKKCHFLGKDLYITFRQLTGYCSNCPNNIFDRSCKKTDMHHYFYIPCMTWACREELCPSCHIRESRRLGAKIAVQGTKRSEECRNNISNGRKGMVFSDEHKRHLSIAAKNRHSRVSPSRSLDEFSFL